MPSDRPFIPVMIEPLGDDHNRAAFSCGRDYIDRQFHSRLDSQIKDNLARAFVAVEPGKKEILGFYVLRSHEIEAYRVPDQWGGMIETHTLGSVPSAFIALFATRERVQGRGIGRAMMADALRRIKRTSLETMGIYAVVLDALDQQAFAFYEKLGFQALDPHCPMRMFYPVSQIP